MKLSNWKFTNLHSENSLSNLITITRYSIDLVSQQIVFFFFFVLF